MRAGTGYDLLQQHRQRYCRPNTRTARPGLAPTPTHESAPSSNPLPFSLPCPLRGPLPPLFGDGAPPLAHRCAREAHRVGHDAEDAGECLCLTVCLTSAAAQLHTRPTATSAPQHRASYVGSPDAARGPPLPDLQTIDGAGAVGHFGPPWSPNEGVLLVPVPNNGSRSLVLRVMDEDWGTGKADDKLGEVRPPSCNTRPEPAGTGDMSAARQGQGDGDSVALPDHLHPGLDVRSCSWMPIGR